jgi:acetate kinase
MSGDILVINTGSSSLKYAVFAAGPEGPVRRESGQVDGIGTTHAQAVDHGAALKLTADRLRSSDPNWQPAAVGHRVVHGGTRFVAPIVLDTATRAELEALTPLDPLHLPANFRGIDAASRAFPAAKQVACFDTSFHQDHPWIADTYALPRDLYDAGVRRYGFHGLSYESIVGTLRQLVPALAAGRVVVAHLGSGASACAIRAGKSVESTMGFSVLDGLPMGTRCGQIDPGVLLYLLREKQMSVGQLEDLLYKKSGLLGLSGISPDMRDLLASDRPEAKQAVDYFVYRVTATIVMLAGCLGGLDGVVFTGGIGEHAAAVRAWIAKGLAWLGVEFDETATGQRLSTPSSRTSAWVIATDEEGVIARHVNALMR